MFNTVIVSVLTGRWQFSLLYCHLRHHPALVVSIPLTVCFDAVQVDIVGVSPQAWVDLINDGSQPLHLLLLFTDGVQVVIAVILKLFLKVCNLTLLHFQLQDKGQKGQFRLKLLPNKMKLGKG